MKILQLVSSRGFFGAESVVAALTRGLRARGHCVSLGLFENSHIPDPGNACGFESRGIPVLSIPCNGRFDRRALSRIRAFVREENVDLVHAHGYKTDLFAWLATRGCRAGLVATAHLWTRQTRAVRLYEFLDGRVLRRFDAVAAVSEPIALELRRAGVDAARLKVIPNGIEVESFRHASPHLRRELDAGEGILIGTAGRLTEQKGLDVFLQAARELSRDLPEARFAIVGEGPDGEKLRALARELGVADKVSFCGGRNNMASVYASLDVFVLASRREGIPMVLLEAMSAGVAVVAAAVGGVPQVITPESNGLLVAAGDASSLARAVVRLVQDPELRRRLAARGSREVSARFSSAAMAASYCRLYEDVLEARGALVPQEAPCRP